MRKIILSLAMLGFAIPAFAQDACMKEDIYYSKAQEFLDNKTFKALTIFKHSIDENNFVLVIFSEHDVAAIIPFENGCAGEIVELPVERVLNLIPKSEMKFEGGDTTLFLKLRPKADAR